MLHLAGNVLGDGGQSLSLKAHSGLETVIALRGERSHSSAGVVGLWEGEIDFSAPGQAPHSPDVASPVVDIHYDCHASQIGQGCHDYYICYYCSC